MPINANIDDASEERRRRRRYHVTVPVRVTIQKLLDVRVINGLSFQMNDGGLEVCTDTELRIGDKAEIEFSPPHFYPPVTLRGVVRNRAGDLYGVEFLAKSARDKEQLGLFQQILARWGA